MELYDKWLEYFKKNGGDEINALHTRDYNNFIDIEAEHDTLMADLFDGFFKENDVIIDRGILMWVLSFSGLCYVELLKAHKII